MINSRTKIPAGTHLPKHKCLQATPMTEVYATRRKTVLVFTWNWPKVRFTEHLGLLTRYYGWGRFNRGVLRYLYGQRVYVYEMPRLQPVGWCEYMDNIQGKPIQRQAWDAAIEWARTQGYYCGIDDSENNWLKCPITGAYIPHDAVYIERYETRLIR